MGIIKSINKLISNNPHRYHVAQPNPGSKIGGKPPCTGDSTLIDPPDRGQAHLHMRRVDREQALLLQRTPNKSNSTNNRGLLLNIHIDIHTHITRSS